MPVVPIRRPPQEGPIRIFPFVLSLLTIGAGSARPALAQSALDVHVLGFADIDYLETDRSVDDGFFLGQLVGHAAAGLSERTTFFAEVSATARPDEYRIEVERLIQMYFRPARRASRSRSPAPGVRRALPDLLPPRPSRVPRDTGRCPRPRAGRRLARVAPSIPGMIID